MRGNIELWTLTRCFPSEVEALEHMRRMQLRDPTLVVVIRSPTGREIRGLPYQPQHATIAAD